METRRRKRAREEEEKEQAGEAAAAPSSSSSSSSTSSSSSFSSAPPPFRGPAADSVLGKRLVDVIGIVAAMGFAAEVSHCLYLCGETWRKGDKGATNDMIARSLERQCGLSAARATKREDFVRPGGITIRGSTQLIRAAEKSDLPHVLQLVQLGALLEIRGSGGDTSLHWACTHGHEPATKALLDGKYDGRGAEVDALDNASWTPLMIASVNGHEGLVRVLLARGDKVATRSKIGSNALTCASLRNHLACEELLRAHGATL